MFIFDEAMHMIINIWHMQNNKAICQLTLHMDVFVKAKLQRSRHFLKQIS